MQVSQSQDAGSMVADEKPVEDQQENYSETSMVLGKARSQILAAQFECYLKMIHDPPHAEEGDKTVLIVISFHSSTAIQPGLTSS